MKVTIIPSDSWVSVDEVGYTGVDVSTMSPQIHAVQFNGADGWIEFVTLETGYKPENEPITNLDQFQAVLDSWAQIDYERKNPPPPSAAQNKAKAEMLLQGTDWTQAPSISDPTKSNPYLANVDAYITYRNTIRAIAINPVAGDIEWAAKPDSVWQSV